MTVLDLKENERGFILSLDAGPVAARLSEIGCFPGNEVKMKYKGWFNDPICIEVNHSVLALRKIEAKSIVIEKFS